jgi:hypothetical protein
MQKKTKSMRRHLPQHAANCNRSVAPISAMKARPPCFLVFGFHRSARFGLRTWLWRLQRVQVAARTGPPRSLSPGRKRHLQNADHQSAGQGISDRLVPDLLSFGQIVYPCAFERCFVDENILSAVIRRDVPETPLAIVESDLAA